MRIFTIEHSKLAYQADFAFYGTASVSLAAFLMIAAPRGQHFQIMTFALIGLASWTLIEYALHRFVLHGLRPFSAWHAEHHRHPAALISTPTLLSATLITLLVFLPGLILGGLWRGCALTFGLLTGYLAYSITHHASHHWRSNHAWMKQRKLRHALHHNPNMQPGHYGVTSGFWDYVFGSRQP